MLTGLTATFLLLLTATSGLPLARGANSGCGSPSPWSFGKNGSVTIHKDDRSFIVHIPANYQPNDAHAVVLSFHGFSQTPENQEKISGLSEEGLTINDKGIIAVYPRGADGPGKDGKTPEPAWQGAPYAKEGVDDISFTQDIVEQVTANLCVDAKRIYASGKSNGGGFTNLLACTSSTANLFAAFAPVSAALYPGTHPLTDCNPGRTVPIINFHGLIDNIIPFAGQNASKNGDTAYALPNITTWREAWANRNGCQPNPPPPSSITKPYTNTTLKEWDCSSSDPRAIVKGYTVDSLKHSWPSTLGLDGGVTSFNATTAAIIPFFNAYTLS